jgi:hypothetical protein
MISCNTGLDALDVKLSACFSAQRVLKIVTTEARPSSTGVVSAGVGEKKPFEARVRPCRLGKKSERSALKRRGGERKDLPLEKRRLRWSRK